MQKDLVSLFGPELHKNGKANETIGTKEIENIPKIALYYSAKWCVPCKEFTPKLIKFYEEVNKDSKVLEIIFVSGDNEEEEFEEYYGQMPWLALPFDDILDEVTTKFPVSSLPCLKVIDPVSRTVKVENAKDDVVNKGVECIGEW